MFYTNNYYCYPYTNQIPNYARQFEHADLSSKTSLYVYNNQPYDVGLSADFFVEFSDIDAEFSYEDFKFFHIPINTKVPVFSLPKEYKVQLKLTYEDPQGRLFIKKVDPISSDITIYTNQFRRIQR